MPGIPCPARRPRCSVLSCSIVKFDITTNEVEAILRAILEVTGARNARENAQRDEGAMA